MVITCHLTLAVIRPRVPQIVSSDLSVLVGAGSNLVVVNPVV